MRLRPACGAAAVRLRRGWARLWRACVALAACLRRGYGAGGTLATRLRRAYGR